MSSSVSAPRTPTVTTDYLIDVNNAIVSTPLLGRRLPSVTSDPGLDHLFDPSWFTAGTSRWGVIKELSWRATREARPSMWVRPKRSAAAEPARSIRAILAMRTSQQTGTGSSVGTDRHQLYQRHRRQRSNDGNAVGDTGHFNFRQLGRLGSAERPECAELRLVFGQANATARRGLPVSSSASTERWVAVPLETASTSSKSTQPAMACRISAKVSSA